MKKEVDDTPLADMTAIDSLHQLMRQGAEEGLAKYGNTFETRGKDGNLREFLQEMRDGLNYLAWMIPSCNATEQWRFVFAARLIVIACELITGKTSEGKI